MFIQKIINELKESKTNAERYLTQGLATDYANYTLFVGKIRGLTEALEIYEALINKDIK